MTILVTGGAGFIGTNFIHQWAKDEQEKVINLDKLTYAGSINSFREYSSESYEFVRGDICDKSLISSLLEKHKPRTIIHFAAESHVDRSIIDPSCFIQTNVFGTFNLLECVRLFLRQCSKSELSEFRFIHVSTDEVFGSLSATDQAFSEISPYYPNSPYSASKASSNHIVRAYNKTFDLPTIITNCSNNYGPYQYPEKLIPLTISKILSGEPIPIYGDGHQIRDWIHVSDHCEALRLILKKGTIGSTYNIGGNNERTNLEVAKLLCQTMDKIKPRLNGNSYSDLIKHVKDRPGHDTRYAVNISLINNELGWSPTTDFEIGVEETVDWFLKIRPNIDWK